MSTEEWLAKWDEGYEGLTQVGVQLERHRHRLDAMQARLDELDRLAESL